jgi:tetratricopeptide (TPR) repeat protein
LAVYQKNGDRFNESVVLSYIALTYLQQSQTDKALNSFEQVLTIAQETSNLLIKALALHGLGTIYWTQNEYDKALNYYEQALGGFSTH